MAIQDVTFNPELTAEAIERRRANINKIDRVVFGVTGLYGLSRDSVKMPLNRHESFDSGQVCIQGDAEAAPSRSIGIVEFSKLRLKVRYAIQAVFPGLYSLVSSKRFDSSLLNPIRAEATDECTVSADYSGWRALGCLEFLPGSLWSGAHGG
ncbi:MAG: hypothetical protein ACM3SW_10420 [Actinomycetota bacterium]